MHTAALELCEYTLEGRLARIPYVKNTPVVGDAFVRVEAVRVWVAGKVGEGVKGVGRSASGDESGGCSGVESDGEEGGGDVQSSECEEYTRA